MSEIVTTVTNPDGSVTTTATDSVTGRVLWRNHGWTPDQQTALTNFAALQTKANAALTTNQTFLALTPTYPLTSAEQQALVAQVVALTKQVDALIHLALNQLADTTGT